MTMRRGWNGEALTLDFKNTGLFINSTHYIWNVKIHICFKIQVSSK